MSRKRYVVDDLIADGRKVDSDEYKKLFWELLDSTERQIKAVKTCLANDDLNGMRDNLQDLLGQLIEINGYCGFALNMLSTGDFDYLMKRLSAIVLGVEKLKISVDRELSSITGSLFAILAMADRLNQM